MTKLQIISFLLIIFLSISSAFSQVKSSNVENPAEYFNKRTEAISLAKSEKWKEAVIILEKLIEQYQNDSDLYYI